MRKLGWVLAGAVICTTGVAVAGQQGSWPVTINSTSRWAQGALPTARNSSDPNQTIQCNSRASGSGTSASYWSYCVAVDSAGHSAYCYTASDAIASVVRSINANSALYFDWDTNGYCGTVIVYQTSYY
jgi:hypothetical protein